VLVNRRLLEMVCFAKQGLDPKLMANRIQMPLWQSPTITITTPSFKWFVSPLFSTILKGLSVFTRKEDGQLLADEEVVRLILAGLTLGFLPGK
jgi:hypothetical protein